MLLFLVCSVSYTLVKIRVKSVHMLHGCGAVHVIGNCWSCYYSTVTAVTSIVSLSLRSKTHNSLTLWYRLTDAVKPVHVVRSFYKLHQLQCRCLRLIISSLVSSL